MTNNRTFWSFFFLVSFCWTFSFQRKNPPTKNLSRLHGITPHPITLTLICQPTPHHVIIPHGRVSEWFMVPVLKTGERKLRKFESCPFRQEIIMKNSKKQITTTIHPDIPTVSEQIRGKHFGNSTSDKQRIIARIILIATPILFVIYILIKLLVLDSPLLTN